jgi:protein TonB
VRYQILRLPLASSCIIHLLVLMTLSAILHHQKLSRETFVPIELIDAPRTAAPVQKVEAPPAVKTPPPPPPKIDKLNEPKQAVKTESTKIEKPAPQSAPVNKEEPAKTVTPAVPPRIESAPSFPSSGPIEGGGSAAGAGNLFGKGDIGVVPGSATSGGGGGTAASGLGRGSEAPGLPAQTSPLRTNREAKPVQMARATYPPTALRMGMEGDVALKIIVDPDGTVSKAEIIKRGGSGFDEEALKAVKQSRFEPAQKDGQNVTAEFTFIFHFKLRR